MYQNKFLSYFDMTVKQFAIRQPNSKIGQPVNYFN